MELKDLLDMIKNVVGEDQIVSISCDITNGLRESTPRGIECLTEGKPLPKARSYEYTGARTIVLKLEVGRSPNGVIKITESAKAQ